MKTDEKVTQLIDRLSYGPVRRKDRPSLKGFWNLGFKLISCQVNASLIDQKLRQSVRFSPFAAKLVPFTWNPYVFSNTMYGVP